MRVLEPVVQSTEGPAPLGKDQAVLVAQVACPPTAGMADHAIATRAAISDSPGLQVHLCGDVLQSGAIR